MSFVCKVYLYLLSFSYTQGGESMLFSRDALLTALHGIVLGGLFLLAYSGGLLGLYSLRPSWVTLTGYRGLIRRLTAGTWIMALVAWLTVLTGTYLILPQYLAEPPKRANLSDYPKAYLLAHPNLAPLNDVGMEWKMHIAWIAPVLATAVAYVVLRYGPRLVNDVQLRRALLVLFTLAFLTAVVAGVAGLILNKVAPIQ
jgi:hypothetical protein